MKAGPVGDASPAEPYANPLPDKESAMSARYDPGTAPGIDHANDCADDGFTIPLVARLRSADAVSTQTPDSEGMNCAR